MGTNYYTTSKPCPHCGHVSDERHIGKSSAGWTFALRVYPSLGLTDWPEWVEYLQADRVIRDEYGETIPFEEFERTVTERRWKREHDVPFGYTDWQQFYVRNHAMPGPNGLARATIDGRFCVGHGSGTWDLMVGEFS